MSDSTRLDLAEHGAQFCFTSSALILYPSFKATKEASVVSHTTRNLGALPKESSADAGYSSYDNLEFAKKKMLGGTVSLPGKYSRLIEEAMLEYKKVSGTIDVGN